MIQRGTFPINPKFRLQGRFGSTAELAVEFMGGIRSYFERELINVYDEVIADRRYEQVNAQFRREIEAKWQDIKQKYQ